MTNEFLEQFKLTKTQKEVAEGLLSVLPREEIAKGLYMAKTTVHNHSTKIYRKAMCTGRIAFQGMYIQFLERKLEGRN